MPTDPEELKKFLAELQKALQATTQATQEEQKRTMAAALAPSPSELDLVIPPRNEQEILGATRRVLTEKTLPADIADLIKKLRAGLDAEDIADAAAWLKTYGQDPSALASAAALAWVQGAPGTALILAAEAAQRAPGDSNVVNTLGSLLADAGYGSRGIPILSLLAQKYPDDPTLQNNLGQAWLGLGEPEKARVHFAACLRRVPGHGAANAGMGVITYCAGDRAAATRHFQTAASSHGSSVARRALKRLDAGFRTPRSFRRAVPVQEFFNPRKYAPPAGMYALSQAPTKQAEVEAFQELVREHFEIAAEKMKEAAMAAASRMSVRANFAYALTLAPTSTSLADLAAASGVLNDRARRMVRFEQDLLDFQGKVEATWQRGEAGVQELRREFEARWAGVVVGEGGGAANAAFTRESNELCAKSRQIMERALQSIARSYDELVAVQTTRLRVATNEELTYLPLITAGDLYQQEFYKIVGIHLNSMAKLAAALPIKHYECGPTPEVGPFARAEGELPEPGGCPIKVHAKLGPVKLTADCKSLGIEAEAGLKFSAKKDFQSGETTLKGGVGAGMDLKSIGELSGGGGFVVVWDRGNSLSFIGIESSASASIAGIPGLSGEMDVEPGVKAGGSLPTGTADVVSVSSETRLGVTLGPRGVESTLTGSMGAEVLGRDLVKASL